GVSSAQAVAALGNHSCALLSSGGITCWGRNSHGQLGDGSTTQSLVPVTATGIGDAVSVAAGNIHSCAALASGQAKCWGHNQSGQLGDGSTTNKYVPTTLRSGLCQSAPDPGFVDVPTGRFFTDAVAWLAATGISTGTTATTFSPDAVVGRKDMAVFIWRAFGSPAPVGANPFGDVPSGKYYTNAIIWLAEQGISTGTSPGVFSPNVTVSRAQMAVFLHRATGLIPPGSPASFGDVPPGKYFSDAVGWLVEVGITTGTAPGVYSPYDDVTRGQMAVFLNRRGCGIAA
ncbi:MAG: S-layer homology domain-containing protein, partial [Microthrixaceae bacterium]|nr:S-layer homology domain-containing protein [Microthrixaceae bacterium]